MAAESIFQAKIIRYLKAKGCYVVKMQAAPGIPVGCPDVIALAPGGGWFALEVKRESPYKRDGTAKKGMFKPLQQETARRLDEMYYARVTWPENWAEVKKELDSML